MASPARVDLVARNDQDRSEALAVRSFRFGIEAEVEEIIAYHLRRGDQRRQVKCGNGRVDIFDETTSEIIECKLIGDADTIGAAIGQLQRYRPYFFDPQLAIGVPILWPSAKPMLEILDRSNIRLIEIAKGIGV